MNILEQINRIKSEVATQAGLISGAIQVLRDKLTGSLTLDTDTDTTGKTPIELNSISLETLSQIAQNIPDINTCTVRVKCFNAITLYTTTSIQDKIITPVYGSVDAGQELVLEDIVCGSPIYLCNGHSANGYTALKATQSTSVEDNGSVVFQVNADNGGVCYIAIYDLAEYPNGASILTWPDSMDPTAIGSFDDATIGDLDHYWVLVPIEN